MSKSFKLKVVQEYLEGSLGNLLLAQNYNVSSKTLIQKSVNQYKMNGKEALQIKRLKKVFMKDRM